MALGYGFFDLDCEQKWLWIVILSLASEACGKPIIWNSAWIESFTKIPKNKQFQAIEIFEKFCRLHVSVRDSQPTIRYDTIQGSISATREKTPKRGKTTLPPLAEIWNSHCGALPKVVACGKQRGRLARERVLEQPDMEFWRDVIIRMSSSPFCRGEMNSKEHPNWKADFDFLLKPETANKVAEGKYDRRKPPLASLPLEDPYPKPKPGGIKKNETNKTNPPLKLYAAFQDVPPSHEGAGQPASFGETPELGEVQPNDGRIQDEGIFDPMWTDRIGEDDISGEFFS